MSNWVLFLVNHATFTRPIAGKVVVQIFVHVYLKIVERVTTESTESAPHRMSQHYGQKKVLSRDGNGSL